MEPVNQPRTAGRRARNVLLALVCGFGIAGVASAAIFLEGQYFPTKFELWPNNATAVFYLTSGGDVLVDGDDVGDWISPKTGMSGYQYRATYDGGCGTYGGSHFTGSGLNTWNSLGSGAIWYATASGAGDRHLCSLYIEIREAANPSAILATTIVSFQAEVW